jgi:tetratricopeptide (TPR) repeat protein
MKRMILTGLLAISVGATCMMAQKGKAKGAAPAQAAAPAQPSGPKGPMPKSKAELEALQALQAAANDPDKAIAAAKNLITKFADTDFKAAALFIEADAYQRKGDSDHMVIFAERTLEANPQEFRALLMLANYYATHTRENDLDREEKLAKSEKLANQVIELMKTLAKPNPGIPDDQWADAKKDSAAEGYNALGLANLARKKYDLAAASFKTAVDTNSQPEPAFMVRLASALQSGGKYDEAIVWCDKVIAMPTVHPQIKNVAVAVRAACVKAGSKAPAGAPPQAK